LKVKILYIGVFGLVAFNAYAGDANFVASFDAQWRAQNASNVLAYVESQVATNRSVETLFARGLVAAFLQKWGRGATNYFGQAIAEARRNTTYSESGRSNVVQVITQIKGSFDALVGDGSEVSNSVPTWDTKSHIEIFRESGDQVPFLDVLNGIANSQ